MSDHALSQLQSASTPGFDARSQLLPGMSAFAAERRDEHHDGDAASQHQQQQQQQHSSRGSITYAALRPGHAFEMPGILEPDARERGVASDGVARPQGPGGGDDGLMEAFHSGSAVGGGAPLLSSAAERLSASYGAYDDGRAEQKPGRATPGWDPTEAVRKHTREFTELNRAGMAHAQRYLVQKEERHGAWHRKFKKAVRDAETPEAVAAQRERLRRHTASQAARRFHAQLAKAQGTVRQPLGRTAPVHEASRGDGTADEHCWQPHLSHGGGLGGDDGGDGGDGDGEDDETLPALAQEWAPAHAAAAAASSSGDDAADVDRSGAAFASRPAAPAYRDLTLDDLTDAPREGWSRGRAVAAPGGLAANASWTRRGGGGFPGIERPARGVALAVLRPTSGNRSSTLVHDDVVAARHARGTVSRSR